MECQKRRHRAEGAEEKAPSKLLRKRGLEYGNKKRAAWPRRWSNAYMQPVER